MVPWWVWGSPLVDALLGRPFHTPIWTPCRTRVAGPESAPLAHSQRLILWLCMAHGVTQGVSLWGTLQVASGATACPPRLRP